MQLHKWSSNCIELLSNFEVSGGDVSLTIPDETKALGLLWRPQKDTLAFSVSSIADVSDSCTITKRSVLSTTAKIFDPLGLISPVVTKAKLDPSVLKPFVKNRVSVIQHLTEVSSWKHIQSQENPVDIISRGIDPDKIQDSVLWWYGPSGLQSNPVVSTCDVSEINDDLYLREFKKSDPVCLVTQNVELLPIINKCSSFVKLKRILAWCLWFKENARNHSSQRTIGSLTATELSRASICLIRNVQSVHFPLEIQCLLKGKQIPNSSSVLNLSPFLDENSILRIGGRLKHSNLTVNQKHPMLIPNKGHISNLLINYYLVLHFHTGVKSTIANIRSEFWIINCRNQAIHLEIVTNCSTDAFLGALKRFISRQGKPHDIFSDNGTNFVGANNELKKILQNLFIKEGKETIENFIASEGIVWHLNPPATPHFGGLWEAGIKSLKSHLKRVIGNTILTYEEFVTLVTQVESVLNSRPLTKISSDPNDSILTPAHFLVGTSLTALPEPDLTNTPINRLNRWQLVQKLTQTFWKKWSNDYLNRLQSRVKMAKG
ncbi:integrase catalytic domain-containing protein [Trichonephila clavipes]|nr:integrase catalytic domain-containing protein [Trichonephila clavipes]